MANTSSGITVSKYTTPEFNGISLKSLRKGAGLTQVKAADILGVSRGYYANIENGHRPTGKVEGLVDVFGQTLALTEAGF